jgi:hypothetical protein
MYTNYDDQGSRFGGQDGGSSIQTLSGDPDRVTSYAALDTSASRLYLMVINKDPEAIVDTKIDLKGFPYDSKAELYLYQNADLTGISQNEILAQPDDLRLTLPAYSITLLILNRAE